MEDVLKFIVVAVLGVAWARIRKRIVGTEDPDPEPLAPAGTELPEWVSRPEPAPAKTRPPAPRPAAEGDPGRPAQPAGTLAERPAPAGSLRRPGEGAPAPAIDAAADGSAGDVRRSAVALISTREGLAQAMLLAEVLGKPRALRPYRGR